MARRKLSIKRPASAKASAGRQASVRQTSKIKKKRKKRSYKKRKEVRTKPVGNFKFFLFSIGLFILLGGGFFYLSKKAHNSFQNSVSPITHFIASISAQTQPIKIDPQFSYQENQVRLEAPTRIVIPSVKIDVPVVQAAIVDGYWETASQSASFGLGSAYPGQVGNIVIFAHAREGLFANLRFIQKESPVYLFTNSSWFVYKVNQIKTVAPNRTEVVSPTKEKTLTLFTCSGYRDAYRLVVIAEP